MATARKLSTFTVQEFNTLMRKHNGSTAAVAAEKRVTQRAIQLWAQKHCKRRVVYECDDSQPTTAQS